MSSGGRGGLAGFLTRKIGPLPTWAYVAGAAAGGVGIFLWKKRSSSAAPAADVAAPAAVSAPDNSGSYYPDGSSGGGSFGGAGGGTLPLPPEATATTGTTGGLASTAPAQAAAPGTFASNPLSGFEIDPTSGTPYITPQQFTYQTTQPLTAANVAANGKGGPNDLSGLAALNGGTGPNAAELAYFDSLNAAKAPAVAPAVPMAVPAHVASSTHPLVAA